MSRVRSQQLKVQQRGQKNPDLLNYISSKILNNNNAFYTNLNILLFPRSEVDFFRVRNPGGVFSIFFIKLILPGPGFEPVTSRVAGSR